MYKGYVYVPVSTLKHFGLEISYDAQSKATTIGNDITSIQMVEGNKYVYVYNGNGIEMEVEPWIIDDEMYVPSRYVFQIFKIDFRFFS
jgi:hypothetical protein